MTQKMTNFKLAATLFAVAVLSIAATSILIYYILNGVPS